MSAAPGRFTAHQVTASDGCVLTAYTRVARGAPTVVLVNAYGVPVDFFVPLAERLAPRFSLMTWDCRGLPGTAHGDCGVPRHAADLWELCAALGVATPQALVGWCTGAIVALHAAAGAPQPPVLVLAHAPYAHTGRARTAYEETMEMVLPLAADDPAYAATLVGSAADGQPASLLLMAQDPALLHLVRQPYDSVDKLQRYGRLMAALFAYRVPASALAAPGPALVITGARDATVHPAAARLLHQHLPGSTLWEAGAGGHFMLYDDAACQAQVAHFLAAHLLPAHAHGTAH